MENPHDETTPAIDDADDEIARSKALVVARLQQRGVDVREDEDAEDLVLLLDAVERFERAVQRLGGDLMVDVPPAGRAPQPDDARFLLPARAPTEPIDDFRLRIALAMPDADAGQGDGSAAQER